MQSSSSASTAPPHMQPQLLFSHAAIYEQSEGQLRITSTSLTFEANDGSKRVALAWAQVEKDLYSPEKEPRVLLRISTVVAGAPALVFQLVNQPRERLRAELERLKGIIKTVRKPASAASQPQVGERVTSTSFQSSRQALLLADAALLREYNALVRDGKIVDEVDFWRDKEGLLASFEASRSISSGRGALSAILSDFAVEEIGREKKIVLNPEIISHIFDMYPAVRKAYDTNVPHVMTEEAFWTQYFRSAYFARDKAASRAAAAARGSDVAVRSDDMFGRYDPSLRSSDSKDQLAPPVTGQESELKKRRLAPALDLTATYNDYAVLETVDVALSSLESSGHSNPIVAKYMKNTSIALRSLPDSLAEEHIAAAVLASDQGTASRLAKGSDDALLELHEEPAPAYVDVSLKGHDGNANIQRAQLVADHRLEQRSTTAVMKSSDLVKSAARAFCDSREQPTRPSVDDTMRRIMLDADSLSVPFSAAEESSASAFSAGVMPTQAQTFPEDFTRVILDHFSYITQLLRHFYAALNQAGHSPSASSATKARKIVSALESRRDAVMHFKKEIQASSQAVDKDKQLLKYKFRCLNELIEPVHRALDLWDEFCKLYSIESDS